MQRSGASALLHIIRIRQFGLLAILKSMNHGGHKVSPN
jgi:hypothetical protein